MAYSRLRRPWRSSSRKRLASALSSCSGSSADRLDLTDQVALRDRYVGKMHPPAGKEHAENPDLPADAVGTFIRGIGVGPHRQIAATTLIHASDGHQTLGT